MLASVILSMMSFLTIRKAILSILYITLPVLLAALGNIISVNMVLSVSDFSISPYCLRH